MFNILPKEIIDDILFISGNSNLINNFGSKYIKYKWYIHNIKNKVSKLLTDRIIRYYNHLRRRSFGHLDSWFE